VDNEEPACCSNKTSSPCSPIACRIRGEAGELDVTNVDSAATALAAVRIMQFDLLLTTTGVAGAAVWPLAEKIRRVRPKLHWWLVATRCHKDEEVLARTLGVTRILDTVPTAELIRSALSKPSPVRRIDRHVPMPVPSPLASQR
jgi:hypothetical protein